MRKMHLMCRLLISQSWTRLKIMMRVPGVRYRMFWRIAPKSMDLGLILLLRLSTKLPITYPELKKLSK